MDKEINEIIQNRIEDIYQSGEYIYQAKELEEILNYITNLQEENNLLKAKIKCMEEITGHNQTQPKDESEIYNEMFR